MKYKVGDKVEVIGYDSWHGFRIGDIVTITELFPDGNPPHYRANSTKNQWYIKDKDIKPYKEDNKMDLSKYNTKPIDFTGCHPVIAEALKQGLIIECEVWDGDSKEKAMVRDFFVGRTCRYRGANDGFPDRVVGERFWQHATPIPKKRKVLKPLAECIRLLLENGWEFDARNILMSKDGSHGYSPKYLQSNTGKEKKDCEISVDFLFEEAE